MTRAFVFPGQGSQEVGMGKALAEAFPAAREVFQEVDEALGQHLFKLMQEGPESDLTLTENTQPAIMAVSLALVRVLQQNGFDLAANGQFAAGHSLGEYSALAAMGAFSISDAAKLLKLRGQAMQRAVPVGQGAMAALLGVDFPVAEEIANAAAQGQVCTAANDNAAGQVVISGHRAAIERALAIATERGAKRSVLLPVSAPFHCPLMQPAADEMEQALGQLTLKRPALPIVANVTATAVSDPAEIKSLLVEQVTGTVRWRESVLYMKEQGVTELIELGNGKVLTGLAKRIDKDLLARSIAAPEDIDGFLTTL
jgi:[acyl-carrier-protein] S-malonyltransferase